MHIPNSLHYYKEKSEIRDLHTLKSTLIRINFHLVLCLATYVCNYRISAVQ